MTGAPTDDAATGLYDDPELYDAQVRGYRDDLPFYRRLAEDHGGPVLELGAGTGRVTAELARCGVEVVAVDASEAMLERARRRLERAGLARAVTWVAADMRAIDLGRRFPLVVAPFNTLMHAYTLPDQDRTLGAVAGHLERGGAFGFDVYRPRFGPQGVLRREAEWSEVGGGAAELFLLQHHDPVAQMVENRYYLDRTGPDGRLRRRTRRVLQRYYTRYELVRALQVAGLGRVQLYGGFDRGPVTEASTVMAGIARAA